jgi:hypothetical protein
MAFGVKVVGEVTRISCCLQVSKLISTLSRITVVVTIQIISD